MRFRSNISSHKEFEKGEVPVREDPEISRRLKSLTMRTHSEVETVLLKYFERETWYL